MMDVAEKSLSGFIYTLVAAGIFIAGVRTGKLMKPEFPSAIPCQLNTDPLTVTDSAGVRWGQLERGIVGCSAQGISVLVPKP